MDEREMFKTACVVIHSASIKIVIELDLGNCVHFEYPKGTQEITKSIIKVNALVDKTLLLALQESGVHITHVNSPFASGLMFDVQVSSLEIARSNVFDFVTFTYDDAFQELFMLMAMGFNLAEAMEMICE